MKITADIDIPYIEKYFSPHGELILKPGRLIQRSDVIDADLLLVRSVTRVDEQLLRGTSVKFVGTVTTGTDHLDTQWLDQAGIIWRDAAGYNAAAVSDYIIAVVAAMEQSVVSIGIIGVGHIGSHLAQRLKALGYQTRLCDPVRAEREPHFPHAPLTQLHDCDIITVHTPLTTAGKFPTRHMIQSIAPHATLINTSRGAVVDAKALNSLQNCCFDVWEGEPNIDLEVLQAARIATPHIAGYSVQCRYHGIERIYQACIMSGIIRPHAMPLPEVPVQTLTFHDKPVTWQEVVLAIFNPLMVTQVMKDVLLKEPEKCATLFDELRRQCAGENIKRHEFSATKITHAQMTESDRYRLTQLGITIKE